MHSTDLAPYIRDMVAIPLLTAAVELSLARRCLDGDCEGRDGLVSANLRLVVKIARSYLGLGLDLADLVSEGTFGLIRAAESFDPFTYPVRFQTHASYWIKNSNQNAVTRQGKPIRVPAASVSRMLLWKRTASELSASLGRPATQEEIAGRLGYSKSRAKRMSVILAVKDMTYRSTEGREADDGWIFLTEIIDDAIGGPDAVDEEDEATFILARMNRLTDIEQQVIKMRYGLGPHGPLTFGLISQVVGKGKDAVRSIAKGALEKLAGEPGVTA